MDVKGCTVVVHSPKVVANGSCIVSEYAKFVIDAKDSLGETLERLSS